MNRKVEEIEYVEKKLEEVEIGIDTLQEMLWDIIKELKKHKYLTTEYTDAIAELEGLKDNLFGKTEQ